MASIGDVAKLAGVSRSTVSLAINKKGYVSKETREKIERAMAELDYIPSELGRNLKKQRSGIIGIIIPDVAHPFFATFLKHAERTLFQYGYKTMVCGTAGREDVEQEYLRMLERHTMDGVIMGAHSLEIEKYRQIRGPVLALDRYISDETPTVRTDKRMIAEMAAQMFIERGRKKVVQLVSSHTIRNFEEEKDQVFRGRLEQAGIEVIDWSVGYNTFTWEGYQNKAREVFSYCPDVDGILGVDLAALACMREAAQRGRRVPEEISIVAIDGTDVTRVGEKTLTAIVQPIDALAARSVEIILDLVEHKSDVPPMTVLPVSIQQGQTL